MSSFGVVPRAAFVAFLVALLSWAGPARAQESEPAGSASAGADKETKTVHVLMKTSKGDIVIALDGEKAPVSVKNFLTYTDEGTYDGTVFHRVISTFMIQGGGFEPSGQRRPTHDPIDNEWKNGLKNERGTIAMARTNDPRSATSQFFINVVDNPRLSDPISGGAGYAVFGKVVKGMGVVDEIKGVQTTSKRGMRDWPIEEVMIEKVRRMTPEEVEALDTETDAEPAGTEEG